MKKLMMILTAAIIVMGLAAVSFAQTLPPADGTRTPHINRRQRHQQQRIGEGIENGSLTAREAARLEREEAKIQHDKLADKADGNLTRRERSQLIREENRASRNIHRLEHNGRHRF